MLINPNGYYFLKQNLIWKGFIYAAAGSILPVTTSPSSPEMVTLGSKGMFPAVAFLLAEPLEVESADPFKKPGVYVDSQGHKLWSSFNPAKAEALAYGPGHFLYVVPGGDQPEGSAAWVLVFDALDGVYQSAYLQPLDRPTYRVKDPVYARYGAYLAHRIRREDHQNEAQARLEKECRELHDSLNKAKLELSRREAPPPPKPPLSGDPTADRLFIATILREGTWDRHRNQFGFDRDMLLNWVEDAVSREGLEDELKGYFLREIKAARGSLVYPPDLATVEEKCAYKHRPTPEYAVEAPRELKAELKIERDIPPAVLQEMMSSAASAPKEEPAPLPEWLAAYGEALTAAVVGYRGCSVQQAKFLRPARTGLARLLWSAAAPRDLKLEDHQVRALSEIMEEAIDRGPDAPLPTWPLRGLVTPEDRGL